VTSRGRAKNVAHRLLIVAPFVQSHVTTTPTIGMRSAIGSPLGAFGGSCASVLLEASRPSNFIRPQSYRPTSWPISKPL
jgi:hypothetical protein